LGKFHHLRFERFNLFTGIPVDYSQLKIIAPTHDPILSLDESSRSYGDIGKLEGLDDGLGFVRPDVGMAIVQGGEDLLESVSELAMYRKQRYYPWLGTTHLLEAVF